MAKTAGVPEMTSVKSVTSSTEQAAARDLAMRERVRQVLIDVPADDTRERVRRAASVIFNEFREIPTTKRTREILGKGSFSTVTDELRSFWASLQQAAQEQLNLSDVPQELLSLQHQAISAIWLVARKKAKEAQEAHEEPTKASSCACCAALRLEVSQLTEQLRMAGVAA